MVPNEKEIMTKEQYIEHELKHGWPIEEIMEGLDDFDAFEKEMGVPFDYEVLIRPPERRYALNDQGQMVDLELGDWDMVK